MDALLNFLQTPTGIAVAVLVVLALVAVVVLVVRRPRPPEERPTREHEEGPSARPPEEAQPLPGGAGEGGEGARGPGAPASGTTAPAGPAPAEPAPSVPVPPVEVPESVPSRLERLRSRLSRSGAIGNALLSVFSRGDLTTEDWEEIEDTLLMADLGLPATEHIMDALRTRVRVQGTQDPAEVRQILSEELLTLVDPGMDRSLHLDHALSEEGAPLPATVLVVGVNGTGKTTTVGKLARLLVAEGDTVLLGAADTFRAAAADQLATWGERVGVEVVRADRDGADPASVAFDAVREGAERGVDVVMVDTAGRLQTKSTLMDELGKVKRVMERRAPVNEVLLVLDATTGQNGMRQAQVFADVVDVTGIVLTKLDGSAKGGIVVSVQKELGVPVKFVGLGEGADDLAPFDAQDFVSAIVGK
ncbi:signal recognition particle-docking protein FtsY [Actinomyces polynesiensis]|uniref:signal recognition particle-docking protein FtsY n=1 Tax=Actinomyces polynesiensis TaxID=1325934 RepID=UPI0005BE7BD5|nr:signal recognition particle-docking protein FtsY [Actinomyces polynesiensis]